MLHGRTETTPHSVVAPAQIVDDTQARIDRIEQRMRSLHVSDGIMSWDGYDDLPVAALPVESEWEESAHKTLDIPSSMP